MVAYRDLIKNWRLSGLAFKNEEEVFIRIFLEFLKNNQLIRGSPFYWSARLWLTVNLPYHIGPPQERKKNPVFQAGNLLLLILKIDNFGKLLNYLRIHKYDATKDFLSELLQKPQSIHNFTQLSQERISGFLKNLLQDISSDFKLPEEGKGKLIKML